MAKKQEPKYADIRAWIADQPLRRQAKLTRSLDELHDWYNRLDDDGVVRWYEIGNRISAFFPKKGKGNYGENIIELLAESLEPDRSPGEPRLPNQLWEYRKIANRLTRAQAKAWAKKRNGKGQPLTLFHVSALTSIENERSREKLLERCLAKSRSVRGVRREVQKKIGRKRSSGRREPEDRIIPTPAIALQDIQLNTEQWMANHEVWFAGKKAALSKVRKQDQTDELLEHLERAEKNLQELKRAATLGLKTLRELKKMTKETLG